jgi:PAS domain S-box-containing protein
LSLQTIAVTVIPLLVISALGLFWLLPQVNDTIKTRQLELASAVNAQIKTYMASSFAEVNAVADLPLTDKRVLHDIQYLLDSHINASISLRSIYVVNYAGRVVAAGITDRKPHISKQHEDIVGIDLSHNQLFAAILQSRTSRWSDSFLSIIGGGLSVGFGIPGKESIVIGEVDLDSLREYFKQTALNDDQLIFMLDHNGQIIADIEGTYTAQQLNLSNIPFIGDALKSPGTRADRFEFNGRKMIGSITNTASANLYILIAQPIESAYATLWTDVKIVTLGLLAALFFGIYAALKISSRLASRFETLAEHARSLAHGSQVKDWPQFSTIEFSRLSRDLKDMADSIQASEARFRAVTETATDAIISADSNGRIIFYNNSAAAMFGYSQDEAIGKPVEILMPDRFRHPHDEGLKRFKASGIANQVGFVRTLSGLRSDGVEFPIEFSLSCSADSSGILFTAIIRNITDRKKLEEKIRQSLKLESIGRLAGGVAHDFNNKLAVILGYAEMSQMHTPGGSKLWQSLNEISKAAEHCRDIASQLLSFSRQQIINPKPVNLNESILDLQIGLPRLIGKDIRITCNLADNLLMVKIDELQVDQIVMNLAVNARDAMPSGGELKISTAVKSVDKEYCLHQVDASPGRYVELTVSDNGSGISKETLTHIFEPFFSTKDVNKGSGLGLATIYGIVRQNKGFIEVTSEPDVGTTFKIYLPVIDESAEYVQEHL